MDKTYRAGLLLGARSDTDDADGTITPAAVDRPPDRAAVEQALSAFIGEIEQVPPAFSAAKVTGRRAYDLARQGEEVALRPRKVRIYGIDVLAYDYPHLELEVRCGKGTYIRSLARDLGERLGCGALIESLRRTRVGPFRVEDAVPLDANAATARARLLPLTAAVSNLPQVVLEEKAIVRLRQGGTWRFHDPPRREFALPPGEVAVLNDRGELALIACADANSGTLRPTKVLSS